MWYFYGEEWTGTLRGNKAADRRDLRVEWVEPAQHGGSLRYREVSIMQEEERLLREYFGCTDKISPMELIYKAQNARSRRLRSERNQRQAEETRQYMADQLALSLVESRLVTRQIVLTVGYDIENLTDETRSKAYMNNELLCAGNTVAAIDELYLYLNNRTAIGYIRACMKRARKKESSLLLASQNVEDFLLPEAAELTKPLFSIPAYQFLFHPGTVDGGKYREALQLEECEYGVVRSCARGNCLFKCGDERYNLLVKTPPHKLRCYGTAGGR